MVGMWCRYPPFLVVFRKGTPGMRRWRIFVYLADCRLAGDPIPAEDCIEFTELTISAG
jgi:hypothetical protein